MLPKGKMDDGIAACRAEMTVDDETKEIWLSPLAEPRPAASATWSRSATGSTRSRSTSTARPLGFELKLDDFDVGFEPGTEQATQVREPGPD